MNDDFKKHPQSITELRAGKAEDGSKWTPRDALINLLRDIDNGLDVDMLLVGYRIKVKGTENEYDYSYHNATPSTIVALELWTYTGELLKKKQ